MKRLLLLLIIASLAVCQEMSVSQWIKDSKVFPDRWLPPSTIEDSLYLSINTNQDSVGVYVNRNLRGNSPFQSELINYQNHFRLDLTSPGYVPYQFDVHKPFALYEINCALIPEQTSLSMKDELNALLFENYRGKILFTGLVATIAGSVYDGLIEKEWEDYYYLWEHGHDPSKEKLQLYSLRAKQLTYSLPILAFFPLATNYSKDWHPGYVRGEKYHYLSLENQIRQKNAVYNFSLCFFSVMILNSMENNSGEREASLLWQRDLQDQDIYQSLEFSSNVLLSLGVVELINWALLKFNKPIITDYISIELR